MPIIDQLNRVIYARSFSEALAQMIEADTMGTAEVACLTAGTTPPDVRMRSTLSRTDSAANSA
jgi:hypothetical protein